MWGCERCAHEVLSVAVPSQGRKVPWSRPEAWRWEKSQIKQGEEACPRESRLAVSVTSYVQEEGYLWGR